MNDDDDDDDDDVEPGVFCNMIIVSAKTTSFWSIWVGSCLPASK